MIGLANEDQEKFLKLELNEAITWMRSYYFNLASAIEKLDEPTKDQKIQFINAVGLFCKLNRFQHSMISNEKLDDKAIDKRFSEDKNFFEMALNEIIILNNEIKKE